MMSDVVHLFYVNDRVQHHLLQPLNGTIKGVKKVGHSIRYFVQWDDTRFHPEWYRSDRLRPVTL